MKESCCQFGPRRQLAGILTEPAVTARQQIVLLVNAGVTPKVGPFRLYAELARRLAHDGFRTLRFDLGNIGDSGQEYEHLPLAQRTRQQIASALDYLAARFPSAQFILSGLCSGAEDSFRYAEQDDRVARVVMIDPFAYRTGGFWWRHLAFRAKRRVMRASGIFRPLPRSQKPGLVSYEYLGLNEARRVLRALLARKARIDFIYTGGMRERFNHAGQLQAMFNGLDLGGQVGLQHLPQLDHTQPFEVDRRLLIETIARQLAS